MHRPDAEAGGTSSFKKRKNQWQRNVGGRTEGTKRLVVEGVDTAL